MSQREIVTAIERELEKSTHHLDFVVDRSEQVGPVWKVFVEFSDKSRNGLDDSLEESTAWWGGPPKGTADVLSVIADRQQINLRYATGRPPDQGGFIRLYPPRYLENLLEYWRGESEARESLAWLDSIATNHLTDERLLVVPEQKMPLRERQRACFKLLAFPTSFLWGPPGTGKTHSLGSVLAHVLKKRLSSPILLLSSTNTAVDEALVSVDSSLELLGENALRKLCRRIGGHYIAKKYQGREHLLPAPNPELLTERAELEASKPDPADVIKYAEWKRQLERVRELMKVKARDAIKGASLVAMTTTGAVAVIHALKEFAPFELVAFDEASQIPIPYVAALSPMGRRVLLAGDPKQLAPIVTSDNQSAIKWLGESVFKHRGEVPDNATCFLNEQSRMVEPICRVISKTFYSDELVVAKECEGNLAWLGERQRGLRGSGALAGKHVYVQCVKDNGCWSAKYHGCIRYESANWIKDAVPNLLTNLDASDILVLTPFRSQRILIRNMLRSTKVDVSTVHKAQGSERHTIIFDPVKGDEKWFDDELAPRLINVALSRAQARLIVCISDFDRANKLLGQIARMIENHGKKHDAIPVHFFFDKKNFPHCMVGQVVEIGQSIGRVRKILANGKKFVLEDVTSGKDKVFLTDVVRK